MSDAFFENFAAQWRRGESLDAARFASQISRRQACLRRDAALAAGGAALVAGLAIAFGIWAIGARSLLVAVSAVSFAAAAPLLMNARARLVALFRLRHEASPGAHLAALQALLGDDRRRLGEARACALILVGAAAFAFGLVILGLESSAALMPASAWTVTAGLVETWRLGAVRRLKFRQTVLEELQQAEGG